MPKLVNKCILKSKNIPLMDLEVSVTEKTINGYSYKKHELTSCYLYGENAHLLPKEIASSNNLKEAFFIWLHRRQISDKRNISNRIKYFLKDNNANWQFSFMEVGRGVSLNDTFWVLPYDSDLRWEDWSPYRNPLDKEIAEIAFTAFLYDFPKEYHKGPLVPRITAEPTTPGVMRKCWVNKEDGIYLWKAYDWRIMSGNRTPVIMKYYAAQLAKAMEIPHIPYTLFRNTRINGQEEIISECPLFTSEDVGFVSAASVIEASGISWDKHNSDSPLLQRQLAELFGESFYADMMLFDAIFLNYDRHLGNFGMLINNNTGKYLGPAPLFDNGATFLFLEQNLNSIKSRPREVLPYSGAYMLFDEAALIFVEERHIPMLKRLTEFQFRQPEDPNLGVDDKVLAQMNRIIRERSKHIIKLFKMRRRRQLPTIEIAGLKKLKALVD